MVDSVGFLRPSGVTLAASTAGATFGAEPLEAHYVHYDWVEMTDTSCQWLEPPVRFPESTTW